MSLNWGKKAVFTVKPAFGDLSLIPGQRTWKICLRGFHRNLSCNVAVDGVQTESQSWWDSDTNSHYLLISALISALIEITVSGEQLIHDNEDVMRHCFALVRGAQIPYHEKEAIWAILEDPKLNVRRKICRFTGRNPTRRGLDWALRELLTLTEEQHPMQKTLWG